MPCSPIKKMACQFVYCISFSSTHTTSLPAPAIVQTPRLAHPERSTDTRQFFSDTRAPTTVATIVASQTQKCHLAHLPAVKIPQLIHSKTSLKHSQDISSNLVRYPPKFKLQALFLIFLTVIPVFPVFWIMGAFILVSPLRPAFTSQVPVLVSF